MRYRFLLLFATALATLSAASPALAVPAAVPYTAFLTDDAGVPLERAVDVTLALYDQADGGPAVWGPHSFAAVPVEGGVLTLVLGGTGQPALDEGLLEGGAVWLEVVLDGERLSPRQEVLSVPYALVAGDAERLGGEPAASFVTDAELPDLSGFATTAALAPVATSGAYADLEGTPDLSPYLRADGAVALRGAWDLGGQPLSNVVIASSPTPPPAPTAGLLWWDATGGELRVHTGEEWVLAGGGEFSGAAADVDCWGCVSESELAFELAPVARTGAYADLAGVPSLDGYALTAELQPVCFSGSYEDLRDAPDLASFVSLADLADVAFSGNYEDLRSLPALSAVARTGAYADLAGRPDLTSFLRADGSVPLAGPWNAGGHPISNLVVASSAAAPPTPAAGQLWWDPTARALRVFTGTEWVAASGGAAPAGPATDLQCTGCVALGELGFALANVGRTGAYADLTGRPDLSVYARTANLRAVCTSASYHDLLDLPDLSIYAHEAELAAVAHSGSWSDLQDQPELATVATSGAYGDLKGAPDLSTFVRTGDGGALDGDLDLGGHRLVSLAVDARTDAPSGPLAGQLWWDAKVAALRVWTGSEWLALGRMPSLVEASGGVFTNVFEKEAVSAGGPVGIPDGLPTGAEATLVVSESGALKDLAVHVRIAHPNARELTVTLLSPGGGSAIVHDHAAGDLGGLDRTIEISAAELATLAGTNPTGTWRLRATDGAASGGTPGQIMGFSLLYAAVRANEVAVTGKLTVAGGLSVGGGDLGTEIEALRGELWCVKNCDAERINDCRMRDCDGVEKRCDPSGPFPDGRRCSDGEGRCVAGTCCIPMNCDQLYLHCGAADDGCGGMLDCGSCATPAVCHQGECCTKASCGSLGKVCGTWSDGCGGVTETCGACPPGFACTAAGTCACGDKPCPEPTADYAVSCTPTGRCQYTYSGLDQSAWRQYDVWMWVPRGRFMMGRPADMSGFADELPQHEVTIDRGYFIAKYELTVAAHEACEAAGICSAPSTKDTTSNTWGLNRSSNGRGSHPQNGISWSQSQTACGWLGGRLPTEAEWEYAVKGPVHQTYPWGESPDPSCAGGYAVLNETGTSGGFGCGTGGTMPVGSMPNGVAWCGALDMVGNLFEWVEDYYHPNYEGAPTDGSAWLTPAAFYRARRGHCFEYGWQDMKTAHRHWDTPESFDSYNGVRCVRDSAGEPTGGLSN